MTRHRFTALLDILPSVVGWGVIVFLLGVPVGTLAMGFVALFAKGREEVRSYQEAGDRSVRESREHWGTQQLREDTAPVARAIADGEFVGGDRVDSLISNHPPDAIVISHSTTLCFYRGDRTKELQGLVVVAENGRLTGCLLLVESGRSGLVDPFAPLPLTVCRDAEFIPGQLHHLYWEGRSALPAVTGGGGVFSQPVTPSGGE